MKSADSLVQALPQVSLHHWRPLQVRAIRSDSRAVEPGDLFVAISGVSVDGHRYVADALRRGAAACVVERLLPELANTPTAMVPDARQALAYLHAAWHGFPGRQLKVIGVTGTDGKTTTTRLISSILRTAGRATASVDTVAANIGGQELDTGFHTTTPDAPALQTYLAEMASQGMEYAVLETTSHGLAQHRVAACEFDVAVVTNITHEHLDYHGSYEAYREAKAMLFRALATSFRKQHIDKVAVLNADDSSYAYLQPISSDRQISYGFAARADLTAREVEDSPDGLRFHVAGMGVELPIISPLVGRYNVYNILAAMAVGLSQGLAPEQISAGVAAMPGVIGRMERIQRGQPFTVIVDFAHTPYSLESALRAARALTSGRLIVVFGCAGLRDRLKRPWMGEIAGRLADCTVITAEDPRTEPLEGIMEEIAVGCRQAGRVEGQDFWREGDRREAIRLALSMALPDDLVIVTGKAHERSMCFGTIEYPWSDHEAVQEGLQSLGY